MKLTKWQVEVMVVSWACGAAAWGFHWMAPPTPDGPMRWVVDILEFVACVVVPLAFPAAALMHKKALDPERQMHRD